MCWACDSFILFGESSPVVVPLGVTIGNRSDILLLTNACFRLSSLSRVFDNSFWNFSLAVRDFMIYLTLLFVSSIILFARSSSASSNKMRLWSLTTSSSIFYRLCLICDTDMACCMFAASDLRTEENIVVFCIY